MKRHSTDAVSLVFGLIFVGIAGWWLVGRFVRFDIPNLGWIAAAGFIVIGLLGVAGSLRRDKRDTERDAVSEYGTTGSTERGEQPATEGGGVAPAAPDEPDVTPGAALDDVDELRVDDR